MYYAASVPIDRCSAKIKHYIYDLRIIKNIYKDTLESVTNEKDINKIEEVLNNSSDIFRHYYENIEELKIKEVDSTWYALFSSYSKYSCSGFGRHINYEDELNWAIGIKRGTKLELEDIFRQATNMEIDDFYKIKSSIYKFFAAFSNLYIKVINLDFKIDFYNLKVAHKYITDYMINKKEYSEEDKEYYDAHLYDRDNDLYESAHLFKSVRFLNEINSEG